MKPVDFDAAPAHLFELAFERLGSVGPALSLTFDAVLSGRVDPAITSEMQQLAPREICVWCTRSRRDQRNQILERRRADRAFPILRAVAIETGFALSELKGSSRKKDVTAARFRAFWRLRQAGWSTNEIGLVLGGRDHSTVIAGLRRFESIMAADPVLASRMRGYSAVDEAVSACS